MIANELELIAKKISKEFELFLSLLPQSKSSITPFISLDIREAGFKISHVDANLFPAGFNNIAQSQRQLAANTIKDILTNRKILIYGENFTRNLKYFENLHVLKELIENAGNQVMLAHDIGNEEYKIGKIKRENRTLQTEGFIPDLILLNNDLTAGLPTILEDIEQEIIPLPVLGWFNRRKSNHFSYHNQIVKQVAQYFDFDPWLLSTDFNVCSNIDFSNKQSLECLANKVEILRKTIIQKYKEYKINREPAIFLKSDKGTFGMGIMVVRSAQEVMDINKKTRNKMGAIKSGVENNEILIQEAIPSIIQVGNSPAEIMAYIINRKIVDLITRINDEKTDISNLNSSGMRFSNIAHDESTMIKICVELALAAIDMEVVHYQNT